MRGIGSMVCYIQRMHSSVNISSSSNPPNEKLFHVGIISAHGSAVTYFTQEQPSMDFIIGMVREDQLTLSFRV